MKKLIFLLVLASCGSVLQVKNGEDAYRYKKYALAIDMLKEDLANTEDMEKRLLLARSFNNISKFKDAETEYRRVIILKDDPDILLEYADVLKKRGRYADAIQVYNMLKIESRLDALIDQEISMCKASIQWLEHPDTMTTVYSLGFNSEYSDYSPTVFGDNIIYTSDRVDNENQSIYDWTGLGFNQFRMAQKMSNSSQPWNIEANTKLNEGSVFFHPNGNEIYFTRCLDEGSSDMFCHIFRSVKQYNGWTKGELVENINGAFNTRHPVINSEGTLMFFSSNMKEPTNDYDLYFARFGNSQWGSPIPLSSMINTIGDEGFPFLLNDTLVFASDGQPGMGGYDIFYTYFGKNSQWVKPINMGSPINSGADDFALVYDTLHNNKKLQHQGYFSSNREGGKGRDDIYTFEIRRHVEDTVVVDLNWTLTIKILEPIYLDENDPNSGVQKYVPLEGAQMESINYNHITDITGIYSSEVDSIEVIDMTVSKEGYLRSIKTIDVKKVAVGRNIYIKIVLEPIHYGTEIVLDQIYYDFNKWDIRADAIPSLDSLFEILTSNPEINIRLSSHTDCRGTEEFNLDLSQKRADSVVEYLIEKGIDPKRLQSNGRGETQPSVICPCERCSELDHQENRRTTFEILE